MVQLLGGADIHQGGVRVDANFGNAAYLAAYLLFVIAIAAWQAVESRGWLRYGLIALAALHTVILISTATRGAILGFVGASALAALLWTLSSGKAVRRAGIIALVAVGIVIGGFFLVKDTDVVRNDPALARVASISLEDGAVRFTLWNMAWQGVSERPLIGFGHEGYIHIFNEFYDPALYAQEPWFDRAHSVYVDWLVAGGIPALLLFVALLISAVIALFRSSVPKTERVFLIAALVAFAFQALFVFDNLLSYILLAAILAMAHEARARPIPALARVPEYSGTTFSGGATPAVIVLTVGVIWLVNIPGIEGSKQLIIASQQGNNPDVAFEAYVRALESGTFAKQEVREQFIRYAGSVAGNATIPLQLRESIVSRAFSEMEQQIAKTPGEARLLTQYASALEATGDFEGAITQATAAIEVSPKKQGLYLQRGVIKWKQGDREGAKQDFYTAYELDRRSDVSAYYAAAGEFITGDTAGGRAFLTEHFGTTTVTHDVLRFAYFEMKLWPELIASARLKVSNSPEDPTARFMLAQAYAAAGRIAEARAEIQATIAAFPASAATGAEFLRQLEGFR